MIILGWIYVLTFDMINISRVDIRESSGEHSVSKHKIMSRYTKVWNLILELVEFVILFIYYYFLF